MVLRLNPRVPVLWRDPYCMQLGVDEPLCTLPGATAATQRMLAALAVGVPRSGLSVIGRKAGASEADVCALLEKVGAALLPEPIAEPWRVQQSRPRVALDGGGLMAPILHDLLAHENVDVVAADVVGADADDSGDEHSQHPHAAVIIGRFAIAPSRHGAWLRRDIPHLPVIFGDRLVRIGPFVAPGLGPCLRCVELERVDADPAWPAIATQLEGKAAAAETVLAATDAAARVVRMFAAHFGGAGAMNSAASILIDARTGAVTTRGHRPHELCGCQALPENVTPLGPRPEKLPKPPSSAATGGAPG